MDEDAQLVAADQVEDHPHPREVLTIYGQDAAQARFLDAWSSDRLHHAWLLRGPVGVGKATLSYRIARALIAEPPAGGLFGDPLPADRTLETPQDCAVQARIAAQSEPRLYVLRREWDQDKKPPRLQTQISVDNVRAMRRFLQMSAADGGWRVVIIDTVDEMTVQAANALLKFLEEPPAETLFLLITHSPAGLLPTIRSRCRTLDLKPLAPDALAKALSQAGAELPNGAEIALSELASGSAGKALRLLAGDGLQVYAQLVAMLRGGRGIDRPTMVRLSELCAGRDSADRYALVLDLTKTLLARLARAAVTGPPPAAANGETELIHAVAAHPSQGQAWAETLARISATTRHAMAVNLDPAQCVIDTFLEIDATLGRVRTPAA
ncbi:MAG: DNA polymerase III subunit delta' [Pseudomonadota bacterium]